MLTMLVDLKVKLSIATELRDNIDQLCNGMSYLIFLKKLIPVFIKLLDGPPVFTTISWEQVRTRLARPREKQANSRFDRDYETACWKSFTVYL